MNELTVEILKQIRDGVVGVGTRVDRLESSLGERIDHLESSLCKRLDGTDQRLDRVERGLLDLGKFMRKIARDQARHERFHQKLEKRRGS